MNQSDMSSAMKSEATAGERRVSLKYSQDKNAPTVITPKTRAKVRRRPRRAEKDIIVGHALPTHGDKRK